MRSFGLFCALLCGCGGGPSGGGDDSAVPADAAAAVDLAGCQPACGGLTPYCNATNHCVGCTRDDQCPMGEFCKIASDTVASCVIGCGGDANCANGQKCCIARCVDPASDPANCGACGMACAAPHAAVTCAAGKCAAGACDPGWGDCNNDPKDGCEANLHADPANCTACGMACKTPNAYVGCSDGCYTAACKFGFDDCNNNPMDGCETKTSADPKNCGSCGKSCTFPNAAAGCVNANCVIQSCTLGFADCDGNAANGCEANVATDGNNCGACGRDCGQGLICKQGGCTCAMCNIPNASATCVNNTCMFQACNPGFADCNMNVADGCEVALSSDKNNCGKCGNVCPQQTPFCSGGACVFQPTLVGSFAVNQGPPWGNNPPCYTCQQACALLFGGNATDYSCSTQMGMIDHMAWVDGWGDSSHCQGNPVAETFDKGVTYNCGAMSCSFSAYVSDHGCASRNYCFK